jgi:hypothetical protein
VTAAQRHIDALDVPTAASEANLRAGRRAEYGHLLHDADPDSTVPVFPDLAKGRVVDLDFAQSMRDGLMEPVRWDDSDCEPVFAAARDVENVPTGGVL